MQPIMLIRVAHLRAFTDILLQIGGPVERELQRAGLPNILELPQDAYIPALAAIKFIERCEYQQGLGDFGFRASQMGLFNRLSEDFNTLTRSAPTLYTRLQQFCLLAPLENTHCQTAMIREGEIVRICNTLIGHSTPNGLHYSEWIQIMAMVEIIRKTAGANWHPPEITFQSRFSPGDYALEHFPETRFIFGHKETSMKIPISLMSQPLETVRQQQKGIALPPRPAELNFPGALKLMLRSYLQQGYPDINLAAAIAETSVRSLQRQLAQFGLNYSSVIQQARFEVAEELLKDPGLKLLDVAYAVGFSDPSNFSRSFRGIAGVTPHHYRRQLAQVVG